MTSISRDEWTAILKKTVHEVQVDRVSIVACGVAFRLALALFPGIALLLWLGSHLLGPDETRSLVGNLTGLLPEASRNVVGNALQAAQDSNPASGSKTASDWLGSFAPLIGTALTLWSTNGGMKALFTALNIVYDKEEGRSFLRRNGVTLLFTGGALLLLALCMAALTATPAILAQLGFGSTTTVLVGWLRWFALFVGFTLGLSLLYRFAPNRELEDWPLVTIGSVLAAALLVLSSVLFSWFTGHVMSLSATYGSFSTVIAFLMWLWLDMGIVLGCAELDSVVDRQTGFYGGTTTDGQARGHDRGERRSGAERRSGPPQPAH